MDQATAVRLAEAQERTAAALEGIARELPQITAALVKAWEEPNFAPMGLAVVDKNSPEARRQQIFGGHVAGAGIKPG